MIGRDTSPLDLDHSSTLSRTLDATLHLGKQVELVVLLRLVIEVARSLCDARFGAIWVLDEQRTMLSEFIHTSRRPGDGGLGNSEGIGPTPSDGQPSGRLSDPLLVQLVQLDLEDHPHSNGSSSALQETSPYLRFPIDVHGRCSGSLYLTEKDNLAAFTGDDEVTATVLSMAAGIAVENARRLGQDW